MIISPEFAAIYATEFTQQWEQKQSVLRGMVTTRGIANASKYVFIVDTKAAPARTRGANGEIPLADESFYSVETTLAEYHHLTQRNNFQLAQASVDQRMSMQRQGVTSINQATDQLILGELAQTTYTTGAAQVMSLSLALQSVEKLVSNEVDLDGNIYALLTPRAWAQMLKVKEFTSADWVSDQPFMKGFEMRNYLGVKWALHTRLPGRGTANAKCFMWHSSSIGHALNGGDMKSAVGYEEKQDRSWSRTSTYQGAKLIMPTGTIAISHDDTAAL